MTLNMHTLYDFVYFFVTFCFPLSSIGTVSAMGKFSEIY